MWGDRNAIRGLYVLISCANVLLYKHGYAGRPQRMYLYLYISILYANAHKFPNGL